MLSNDVPLCVPQLVQVSQLDDAMSKIDECEVRFELLKRHLAQVSFPKKAKHDELSSDREAREKNLRELEISCLSMTRVSHPH